MELREAFTIFQQHEKQPLMPWLLQGDHICRQPRPHRLANCPWGWIDDDGVRRLPDELYTEADARQDTRETLAARLRSWWQPGDALKPAIL